MTTMTIHPLPQREFERLAGMRSPFSISIYLPMDLKGKEQNRHLGQARLRQCINEVARKLDERDMTREEIRKFLKPVEALISNVDLWRNPAEGLAIFLSPEMEMRHILVPLNIEQRTCVNSRFCLSPLLPLYEFDGHYYLLELSRDYVRLYEASPFKFRDLHLEDVAPKQLEDAVGFDYKQKNLQFRTGQSARGASFHGQGAGKDDEGKELVLFFRMIDEGVRKKIKLQDAPLVLSCVDELVPLYKKVNTHPLLYKKHLSGDPEFKNNTQRHEQSWELIKPYFVESITDKQSQFKEQYHTGKVLTALKDIIPAAVNGQVDTLFIARGKPIYGSYDKEKNTVTPDGKRKVGNTSLSDLAAMKTFLQGGHVYFMPKEDLPEQNVSMVALLRY